MESQYDYTIKRSLAAALMLDVIEIIQLLQCYFKPFIGSEQLDKGHEKWIRNV